MKRHPIRRLTIVRRDVSRIAVGVVAAALAVGLATHPRAQPPAAPEAVTITSGALKLRAFVFRPPGNGPFPAVLFNHGSYGADDPMPADEPSRIGPVFARHGYILLFLFRQGVGLSKGQGTAGGDLIDRATAADGDEGFERVLLTLLETEELDEALAALAYLRTLPGVDPQRVAVAGHSFGGPLSLLVAEREPALRAVAFFAGAAASWKRSPALRARLLTAVKRIAAPVFFIYAANDYSTAPGERLAAEMERLGKPHRLKIYPAFGGTPREGHNLVYRSVPAWEADVFPFLDPLLQR